MPVVLEQWEGTSWEGIDVHMYMYTTFTCTGIQQYMDICKLHVPYMYVITGNLDTGYIIGHTQ